MRRCTGKYKMLANLFLAGLLGLTAVQIANGQGSERQAWVGLVKGIELKPAAEDTLRRTITFLNHYPRSSRKPIVEYMLGEIYFRRGKYDQALAYYKQLTTKLDHIAFGDSAMFRMGECYFNLGQIDKAEEMWNAMGRRYSKTHLRAEVEANQCQILLKQGKMQQAAGRYRSLLSRYPHYRQRESILVGLAQIDFAHQKYTEVLKRLARLDIPEALYLKGRSLFALKRYQEAATYFDKIVKFHKNHAYAKNSAYLKAEAFFQAGNHKAAAKAFTGFLQRYPRGKIAFFARYKLAAVLLRQKRYKEALANINRLLADQQQPLSGVFVKYLRAEIYVGLKHFRQASAIFREILTGSPPEQILETCLLKYAWVLYKNKQYPLAIKTAYRYIQDFSGNPRAVSANFIVANSHYFMRNYTQAVRAYRNILSRFEYSMLLEIALVQMQITYLKMNQWDQIISRTSSFLKKMEEHFKPDNRNYRAMGLYFLGEAYYRQKRASEAIKLHEKIVAKYWDTTAYAYSKESLVWALFEMNQFTEALQEAEKVIKDRRLSKSIRSNMILVKGHCLFNRKQYKKALIAYKLWLEQNPKAPERINVQYLMGLAYYRLKAFKSALQIWEKVIAQPKGNKFSRDALLKVADTMFRGGDYQRARARYKLFIQRYPKHTSVPMAHLRVAQTYYNQGSDQKAIMAYQQFIQRFPNHESAALAQDGIENTAFRQMKKNPGLTNLRNFLARYSKSKFANQVQYQVAETFYKRKEYGTAIREFNKLILNYPGSEAIPNSMFYLGDSYDQLKKYADAISAYSLFAETYPKNDLMPEVLSRLGAVHFMLKNFEEAIISYRQILDKFPVKPYIQDALYNIAVCYEKMKKSSEAMAMYMDFAERYPNNSRTVEARIQIGIYYQDQQLWDLAIAAFRKALKKKTKHLAEINFRIGDCYENMNNTSQAVKFYVATIPLLPKRNIYRITAMSQLAAVYERQQRWSRAIKVYRDIARNAAKAEWRQEAAKRVKLLSQP